MSHPGALWQQSAGHKPAADSFLSKQPGYQKTVRQ